MVGGLGGPSLPASVFHPLCYSQWLLQRPTHGRSPKIPFHQRGRRSVESPWPLGEFYYYGKQPKW